jgi:hypothetical protein
LPRRVPPRLFGPALPVVLAALAAWPAAFAQEADFQVYTESPRLFLQARRLKLLKRERERDTIRWQQFDALMTGKARMPEPGFAGALFGIVSGQPSACQDAGAWAVRTADPRNAGDLRQMALVADWCSEQMGEGQGAMLVRRLVPTLKDRPAGTTAIVARALAAFAIADQEPQAAQDYLRWSVETWWRGRIVPRLNAGQSPFPTRREVFAMAEFLHVVRDNLRLDLREAAAKWFDELPPMLLLAYYPQPWPAPENLYRIPAYIGTAEPNLEEAALGRAAEFALVAFDSNAMPHQFLQGWLIQDRFLLRGAFGVPYEFLWANPYQPGLSYQFMPDLFHGSGRLFVRAGWEDDAAWFGLWDGQAQYFAGGRRAAVKIDSKPAPLTLASVRIVFASAGLRFDIGWLPPPEEGAKRMEETVFVLGLEPGAAYDVEVDDEEMFEARADSGGIAELRFPSGRKAGVRVRKAAY